MPRTVKACRICLSMDRKLYQMKNYNLKMFYEVITGIDVTEEDRLPQKLCWECAHRLAVCIRFKSKAIRANTLMVEMLQATRYLTNQHIVSIDCHTNNLTSDLSYKTFNVNHSNLHLHDTSIKEEDLQTNPIQEVNVVDIKDEQSCMEFDMHYDENSSSSSNDVLSKHKRAKRKKEVTKKKETKREITKEFGKECDKIDRRRKPANEVLNEQIFDITDLSYDEQVSEILNRQETANYKNSEFKCTVCYKGFLDEDAYMGHINRHTDESGTYECDICKIRFKKQHALRNHTTSHMQKFSCKRCPYVTTRRHAAKLHEEFHNGTRYQCPHCQEDFVKISTYMSHIRIKHPSDFVCEICGYSFVSAKGLGLHKKLKHRFNEQSVPEDGPCCIECDVRFVTGEALERHLKLSAKHKLTESTRKRGRRALDSQHRTAKKQKQVEQKRRRTCKPEGPISCEQCDMQLPDSLSYYRHFRRTHPDKNRTNYPSMKSKSMCEVCGKMFQSLALLHDHSWTHTEAKQFACAQCGKRFQRRYRLIAHARVHAAPRAAHACALCAKRFSTASNMQRHMFSHTGLKPFKCEMCGKCFKHASEKRVHITYVHLKKPWPKRTRGKRRTDSKQSQPPPAVPSSSEMEIVQPLWPACNDPKIGDIFEGRQAYVL